jgi:hypothetical protein
VDAFLVIDFLPYPLAGFFDVFKLPKYTLKTEACE